MAGIYGLDNISGIYYTCTECVIVCTLNFLSRTNFSLLKGDLCKDDLFCCMNAHPTDNDISLTSFSNIVFFFYSKFEKKRIVLKEKELNSIHLNFVNRYILYLVYTGIIYLLYYCPLRVSYDDFKSKIDKYSYLTKKKFL